LSSLGAVLAVATVYLALLFALARWAEHAEARGRRVAGNAIVYTLSLATYCTTWTYYGSVGFATTTGLLFLAVYVGPTLGAALWWWVLRKMVRIKNAHQLTSVADLLSLRFGRSQLLGAVATVGALATVVPYVALQLKTMIATTALLTGRDAARLDAGVGRDIGIAFVVLLAVFTVAIGIRRPSPAERHPGIVVSAAAEAIVKLVGVLAVGAFVTYGLFGGFGDVFRRAAAADLLHGPLGERGSVASWIAVTFESAIAVVFLPRQFHLAVVENADERHIRTAAWGLPLYLLAINLFTFPLAMAGLLLGHPAAAADTFVLGLPLASGQRALSWLVFLGGLSAGTGMIVCEAMTVATMVSNHLVLPVLAPFRRLAALRRHLLPVRWAVAALLLGAAFAYERVFGNAYELVSLGLVAHSGALVVGLAILAGLYWRRASTAGALAGVGVGLVTWAYTLVLPLFVRGGWLPARILSDGPAAIAALRPEALFGVAGLDRIPHAVLWIVLLGGAAFLFASLLYPARAEEQGRVGRLVDVLHARREASSAWTDQVAVASVAAKRGRAVALLSQYHRTAVAEGLADGCLEEAGAEAGSGLSALQLASFETCVETALAASIGSAAAHAAVKEHGIVSAAEERAISGTYARLFTSLKVPPSELQRAIDYHRERERILAEEADAQRFLAEVSGRLGASLDLETTGRAVAALPVPHLSDAALVWIAARDRHRPRAWACDRDREGQRRLAAAVEQARAVVGSCPDVAQATAALRPVLSTAVEPTDWPLGAWDPARFAAAATFPLLAGGAAFGALTLFLSERSRQRLSRHLAVCDELSRRSAIALDNAMLLRSAEDAIRAREEFLAVASHEIKTPLTPLRLKLQMVQRLARRGVAKGELSRAIDGVDGHVSRLVALTDELLDVSRIGRHGLRLVVGRTELDTLVRGVVERLEGELARARCRVTVSVPGGIVGAWDRSRLEQVLANLLVNAAKYAPGAIEVEAEADALKARVVVRDHGPGIDPDDRDRIFEPFERAVSYRRASGFGLGLYIVRRIVEAHGGAVRVESEPGEGAAFVVDLPLEPPAPEQRAVEGGGRAHG
jgi:signal transduction histidine kinase/Na+/proline symporter